MWPFAHRRQIRDRRRAQADVMSLGNLLRRTGMIDEAQLRAALDYQDANPDRMLGEALVAMGVVEAEIIEALLAAQQVRREEGRSLARILAIAKNRKLPLKEAHERVAAAAASLVVAK